MTDRGCRGRGTWEGNERPGDGEYRPVLFQLQIGLWEGHRLSAYGRSNSFSCVHGDPREGSSGSSVRTSVVGRGPCRVLESLLAGGPEASDLLPPLSARLAPAASTLALVGPVWPQCGPGGSPAAGLTPQGQ